MEDTNEPVVANMIQKEFWENFYKELDSWDKNKMSENELSVYNAIRQLFLYSDDLDMLNKKAVYLYLREITGLNTKQVVNNLNRMKGRYKIFREKWDEGEL